MAPTEGMTWCLLFTSATVATSGMSLKSYGINMHKYELLGSQTKIETYIVSPEGLYFRAKRRGVLAIQNQTPISLFIPAP
jgi:hypothetical protein